ncbi:hypothetical protein [Streptomyces sp. NPDC088360]|uniref:hypothetical protein n=1 Tax=Streptomyces sp. NPDC088360 TaxID=3154515 RepID=UPI003450E7B9
MPKGRDKMKYFTEEGQELSLYASGASRLEYVAGNAPVGRLQTPGQTTWAVQDVRKMQDTGLWTVEWVEPGDDNREGGWVITGLTEFGRNVLAQWRVRQAKSQNDVN